MTETPTCPRCGRVLPEDAPRGLCPACLLGAALVGPDETADHAPSSDAGAADDSGDSAPGPHSTDARPGKPGGEIAGPDPQETEAVGGPALPATIRYFGDYELLAELGHGGMGVVYRAHQVSLNRPVALKLLRAGVLAGEGERRRFRNEAEAVPALDHPGLVPVYEVGRHDGRHHFSIHLVERADADD